MATTLNKKVSQALTQSRAVKAAQVARPAPAPVQRFGSRLTTPAPVARSAPQPQPRAITPPPQQTPAQRFGQRLATPAPVPQPQPQPRAITAPPPQQPAPPPARLGSGLTPPPVSGKGTPQPPQQPAPEPRYYGGPPLPVMDFNTMSEDQLRGIAYANNEDWGSLYNKLQQSELGQQYQKGYNDFLGLQREYLNSTQSQRPDQAQAQNTGNWDDYNNREGAYLRQVDQLVQQDPRYEAVKPYSQSHMFRDYLNNQTATNDPRVQQFQAADSYFRRFVEPKIQLMPAGFPDGSNGVPMGPINPNAGMLPR